MSIRITCIKKSGGYHENPYTAIESMSWKNESSGKTGNTTRIEMYNWIEEGGEAYVRDRFGNKSILITAISANGTKYVKTKANDVKSDNLLSLPEC